LQDAEAEALAVALADQTVIDTQGSGRIGDLAAIQRGGEAAKFLTTFYSYFSTTANLQGEAIAKAVKRGEIGQLAGTTLAVWFLPAVLTQLITGWLRGDEKELDWKEVAKSQISYGMGMLVGIRELSGAIEGYSYRGPGALWTVGQASKLITEIGQGQVDTGLYKAAVGTALAPFGLPALEVQRLIDAWVIADENGDHAAAIRAALFGKPRQ
jgi:hypothetical protein